MKHQTNQDNILREKLIYRYVQAMDQGDAEEIAAVLEVALDDPELDRIITEIDMAYQEEEKLTPIAQETRRRLTALSMEALSAAGRSV